MPSEPNSLTISAVPLPSGVSRNRRTSVVLPAPRKPVTIVTGSRDPRSRFCRRPNFPADCEGNRSKMVSSCKPSSNSAVAYETVVARAPR